MKKILILAVSVAMACGFAQAKEMKLKVLYNEIEHTRGELYQYAGRYLGTKDVEIESGISYELTSVQPIMSCCSNAGKEACTDSARCCGRPQKCCHEQCNAVGNGGKVGCGRCQKGCNEQREGLLVPLNEETLLAANLAKKAECVAKQIYQIRETRMSLLAGDVEHVPADGMATKLVLDELNRQEEALTRMFVGSTKVRPMCKTILVDIADSTLNVKQIAMRFSRQTGPLAADASSGDLVVMDLQRLSRQELASEQPKNKKSEPVYQERIYRATLQILYKDKVLYEKTCDL